MNQGTENPIDPEADSRNYPPTIPKKWGVPCILHKARLLASGNPNIQLPSRHEKTKKAAAIKLYHQARSMAIESRRHYNLPLATTMARTKTKAPKAAAAPSVVRKNQQVKVPPPAAASAGGALVPVPPSNTTTSEPPNLPTNQLPGNERGVFEVKRTGLSEPPPQAQKEVQNVAATLNRLSVNDPQPPLNVSTSYTFDGGVATSIPGIGVVTNSNYFAMPSMEPVGGDPTMFSIPELKRVDLPMFRRSPTFEEGHVNWAFCSPYLHAIEDLTLPKLCVELSKPTHRVSWASNVKAAAVMSLVYLDVFGNPLAKNTIPISFMESGTYRPLADRIVLALDYIYRDDQDKKRIMKDRAAIGMLMSYPWWSTLVNLGRQDNNIPVGSPAVALLAAIGVKVNMNKSDAWLQKFHNV